MIVFSCIGPIVDKDETSLKAKIKDLKKYTFSCEQTEILLRYHFSLRCLVGLVQCPLKFHFFPMWNLLGLF